MHATVDRRFVIKAFAPSDSALITYVVSVSITSSLTPPSGCVITGPTPTSLVTGQSGSFSVTCSAGSAPLSYASSRTLTGFSSTAQSFTNTPFSSATTTVASATYSVNVSNAAGNQVAAPINVANGSFTGPPASTGADTLIFIHPDVKGSPIMATDAAGNVAWREDYSAFGERTKNAANANAGTAANQNWFIGKPQDTQTGLVYFGARWYDPVVGRFLGFDPAGVDEHNPHSFNRYSYGNNNPFKFLDPDGRQVAQIAIAAVGLYAAGSMMAPQAGKGAGVMAGGTPPAPSSQIMGTPTDGPKSSQIMPNPIQVMGAFIMSTPISVVQALHILTAKMFGEKGTQVHSQTVWGGGKNALRIDVEKPAPGQRPGQIHYQHGKEKYLYDAESKSFPGAPKSVNELTKQPDVQRGIDKGMKILGEKTE